MNLMLGGVAVLAATIAAFWALLPRGEQRHRFVETEFEPYVAVALTAMVALSFTLLLAGALNQWG